MYQDAVGIFYTENSFTFCQAFSLTASFFRKMEPSLAKLFRNITIEVPWTDALDPRRDSFLGSDASDSESDTVESPEELFSAADGSELDAIIGLISEKIPLNTLHLTFDTTAFRDYIEWTDTQAWFYKEHCKLIQLSKRLRGIQRITVRCCDSDWNDEMVRQLKGRKPKTFQRLERELEQQAREEANERSLGVDWPWVRA